MTDSRDVKLQYLYNRVMKNGDEEAHNDLIDELNHRKNVDRIFKTTFADNFNDPQLVYRPQNFDCLRALYTNYEDNCGFFEDYSLKYVKYLVNACETGNW